MKIVKNDLFDYKNRFIYQFEEGFKFSLDSILLAEYVKPINNGKILDMCTGNAPVPLIMSLKMNASFCCFEIQKEIAELASKSVSFNNLDDKIKIVNDNVLNIGDYFKEEFFDIITCNPPYFKVSETGYTNTSDVLSIARHEIKVKLEDIFNLAFKYLKNNGILYMVHRAERLDEIILFAQKNRVPVKEIQFITTKEGKAPSTIIVKCVKNGKNGVKIKPVVCVDNLKTYQEIFNR